MRSINISAHIKLWWTTTLFYIIYLHYYNCNITTTVLVSRLVYSIQRKVSLHRKITAKLHIYMYTGMWLCRELMGFSRFSLKLENSGYNPEFTFAGKNDDVMWVTVRIVARFFNIPAQVFRFLHTHPCLWTFSKCIKLQWISCEVIRDCMHNTI